MTQLRPLAICVALAVAGLSACTSRELAAPAPVGHKFPPEAVAQGRELAAIGNCAECHTAPGGKPYAGGRALKTPFGTIYGTNITPEEETGIGRWSEEAFRRALREGVDRAGSNLYPAFPYDHYTKLTDGDIAALYAFIMTREPIAQKNRAQDVPIPRAFVSVWKSMYLDRSPFKPDPASSAQWNRGAYLSDALGHCGACHTPRNRLGAEVKQRAYSGGDAEGWHAPALDSSSPSPVPWTEQALAGYLRNGIAEAHAVSAGPMVGVVHGLAQVSPAEVQAIATYIVSLDRRSEDERRHEADVALMRAASARGKNGSSGANLYKDVCADCHDRGREVEGGALWLPLGTALTVPTPRNLAAIIRDGIVPPEGERGPWMPAYAGALTDEQLAQLLVYLRSLTGRPPWHDVSGEVAKLERGG